MKIIKNLSFLFVLCLLIFAASNSGCSVYSFRDVSIPDSIKTVRVNFIENRATYVNPQLSPALTDRLRRKITGQTRLTQTNADNAHYDVSATVTDYTVSTSGVSNQSVSMNRLTITVQVQLYNRLDNNTQDFSITRNFDFPAVPGLQTYETQRLDQIVSSLSDDIFNRLFSNW